MYAATATMQMSPPQQSSRRAPPSWARLVLPTALPLALATGCSSPPEAPGVQQASRPNLLLITVDTLRADRLGCYGNRRGTSPNMDRLASEGVLFQSAYAQRGSTWPSLVSILSSQHPVRHGVRGNGQRLQNATTGLAQVLGQHGYRSAAVLTNAAELGWRGFDELLPIGVEPRDELASDEALGWLDQHGSQPFFLWIHYVAPHDPYQPPAAHRGFVDRDYRGPVDGSRGSLTRLVFGEDEPTEADRQQLLALYDGEVAWSDAQLGRIIQRLQGGGLLDHTLVVATSDHGEELLDRHRYPFHNASVYESSLRIPLLMRWPGTLPAGVRQGELVSSIDLAPTILELMGLPVPGDYQGSSLAPLLLGSGPAPGLPVISELEDRILSLRTERHRFVFNPWGYLPALIPGSHIEAAGLDPEALTNHLPIGLEELYLLSGDPLEQTDRLAELPQAAERRGARGGPRGAAPGGGARTPADPPPWARDPPPPRRARAALGYVVP